MCRKPEPRLLQAFMLPSRAVVAVFFVLLLFGVVLDVVAASSGKGSSTGQTDATPAPASSFTQYVPAGYSIEGPLTIVSATTNAISFFSGRTRKPKVLELTGKQVSVKDQNNNSLSFSALTDGVRVYVCRSTDNKTIIIFVVPSTKKGNDNV